MNDHLFFVRYALHHGEPPQQIADVDWDGLYRFANEQAIVGVLFEGVKCLSEQGLKPPRKLLMEWIAVTGQIEQRNRLVNQNAVALAAAFKAEGYNSCLLKGQGNNLLYSSAFSRTPGDIDLWITPAESNISEKQREKKVLGFLRKKYPNGFLHYNHIDGGIYNSTEVEVHHRPRFLNNLVHNARLQKWIECHREEQFGNYVRLPDTNVDIAIPTWDFNVVFQLAHIYGHVLQSGIGLKQMIDYYYLLKADGRGKKEDVEKTMRWLGLYKVASTVMWVLHEALGLEEEYLIVPPNEKLGKFLLDEIMRGGNFGQYEANGKRKVVSGRMTKNLQRLQRDFRLLRYFPSECLWEPVFRIYHWFWRLAH